MKKSLLTLLIFVMVLVNLVLTIILTISIVPQTKKANELITKVCTAIDLDIAAGDVGGSNTVAIENVSVYNLPDSITINLKKGPDGVQHYAVINVTLSIDTTQEDATKFNMADYQSHTLEEVQNNTAGVQQEILESIQSMFGSNFVFAVGFSSATYQ